MLRGILRSARYARGWKNGADVCAIEVEIDRCGAPVPATLMTPLEYRAALPGWIALGGISCMGRHHPQLVRFARALASSGAAVLVPEIPEWRRLELAPTAVAPTLRGAIDYLKGNPDVAEAPLGLIGFSFGAPQVAISASTDELGGDIGGITLFGGYCSLERTMTCQLTGEHEWEGLEHQLSPDPFGGWVVAGNHLTDVPGFEDAGEVAAALYKLAQAASGQRISAWDPRHDDLIRQLRATLPQAQQRLFDLFATPSDGRLDEPDEARDLAIRLAQACRRIQPLLDPADALTRVDLPTRLVHGRSDRLIPFTESLRLQDSLPADARRGLTVTGLFHHTADTSPPRMTDRARETFRMFETVRGMLNMV